MKTWLKIFLSGLLLHAAAASADAQTNSVSINRIVAGTVESVTSVTVSSAGSGYSTAPTVSFTGGGGGGASATATLGSGVVSSLTISTAGSGYGSVPTVTLSGGGGSGATATATLSSGAVTALTVTSGGSGYTSAPTVTISGGIPTTNATATATVTYSITGFNLISGGSGYTSAPTVTLTGGGGTGATATAVRGATGQAFSNPNEAYGTAGTTIYIAALGTGTFPAAGWNYNFLVNGSSIGTISAVGGGVTAIATWTPPQPGSYSITVQATGIGDTVTSLPVRYFATGTSFTSPVNGSIVPTGSSVVVEATATPQPLGNGQNAFVQRIDFFVDGSTTAFASDSTAPYSAIYTPTTAGSHTLEAKAYDNLGNQISANGTATRTLTVVTPVGTVPTSIISSPQDNAVIGVPSSALTVSVNANPGLNARITRVELYIDGALSGSDITFPYSFSWLPTVVGSYRLVALAYDNVGNVVASSTNTVRIAAPPTVAVTKPTANATVTGGSPTTLSAVATTATTGATISSVQFFVDGTFVGESTTPESGNTYNVTAALSQNKDADGNVKASVVTVLATDSVGLSTNSVGVSVNVTAGGGGGNVVIGAAPTISITSPTNGSSMFVNQGVSIVVAAADSDGHPTSVVFVVDGKTVASDDTYPFSGIWTPTSLGTYVITAKVTDDKGNTVTSSAVNVLVADPAATNNSDTTSIYTGTYSGLSGGIETGNFALVTVGSRSAVLMAYSTTTPYRTYYYANGTVNGSSVSFPSSSLLGSLSASTIGSGVSGTFDGSRLTMIGQLGASSETTVAPGYYQGSLGGRASSRIIAIVGMDRAIFVYATDGAFSDVGSATVSSSGSFTVITKSGNVFTGMANPISGLMAGSISGANTASFTGALTTGGTYSDGVLKGLSTRGFVGTGANVMIAGFVVNGTVAKQIIVRGIGPSLAAAGVSGVLANPKIDLFNSSGAAVSGGSNDNWSDTPANRALMATVGLGAPGSTLESFAVANLAPGVYTAQLSGVSNGTGVGLVEIYDTDTVSAFSTQKVTAISTRGFVNTGDGSLIAGFIVNGTSPKKVLIEAVGPSLSGVAGLLADPVLQIIRNGVVIRENDNWEVGNDRSLVLDAAARSGATALAAGGKDAAILINLQPGTYTAVASGAGGSTGIALINVYEVP
ncbi:MAG: hypothetical protein RL324_156 [Verrucomicrobiota bacterium]|jgi:hypothetical protein